MHDVMPPNQRHMGCQVKLSSGTVSRERATVSHECVGRPRVDEAVHLPHERLGCRRRLLVGQGGHDSIEVFVRGVEQPLSRRAFAEAFDESDTKMRPSHNESIVQRAMEAPKLECAVSGEPAQIEGAVAPDGGRRRANTTPEEPLSLGGLAPSSTTRFPAERDHAAPCEPLIT